MKSVISTIASCLLLGSIYAQEQQIDSTKIESLEEVVLKHVRVDSDSPVTHSNVTKEELAARNLGQDIPILLNFLPAVVTTSDAGAGVGYTGIRVRGSDASRVNVTINGIPYNDAESQGTFWVDLPDFASSVESLQLQRGVGTSTNGSGAFGASLNILSDAVSEEAYGQIASSFGSFNTWKNTLKFSTGLLKDRFEVSGRLSKITSDGYIDRASSDLKSYFLQGAYAHGNTLIKALIFGGREETYQSWFGIDAQTLETDRRFNPAGIYTNSNGEIQFYDQQVDNYAQDHYQLIWSQRWNSQWTSQASMNYTYGRGYFEEYVEDGDREFHGLPEVVENGESVTTSDLIRRRWLDNDFYAFSGNATYNNNGLELTSGIFLSDYMGDHFGEVIWARVPGDSEIRDRYYFGTGDKGEFSIFSKASWRVNDQWTLFGDLQGRFVNYKTDGLTSDRVPLKVDQNYEFFNPKAGVTFQLDEVHQFYGSYGRANREPRRSDFEQGIFNSEKLDDFELGWRAATNRFTISSNLYYMDYTDQLVLTGALDDVGAPIRETSGSSYRLGLEVDAQWNVANSLVWRPNLALSSNKNRDFVTTRDGELVNLGTTDISFSPSVIAGSIIEYAPAETLKLALLSKYVGEQYMGNVDSEVSKLDSYFTNDLNVVYQVEGIPFIESLVLTGLVNNIFNVEYVSNGYYFSFEDDFSNPGTITTVEGAGFYPQATINFLVGATVTF